MSKPPKSHRRRALCNLGWITLGAVALYLHLGAPYFTRQQADDFAMARGLASQMEVVMEFPVPKGSHHWSPEAEEIIYLLRYEDTVATMLTKLNSSGNSVFFGPSNYVQEYENRDGMAILPLYGTITNDSGTYEGIAIGVVPTKEDIVRVDVLYWDEALGMVTVPAQQTYDGVFVAECIDALDTMSVTVYDDLMARRYFGAMGYDIDGNLIAQTRPD